ncbi:MAG TPA: protoporphyrinogen oxidase [Planctomycetota bacterium]|nr:protoporphyrinogen oxidase [Planctomycetota bacterium]
MAEPFDLVVVGAGAAGLSHAFWRLRAEPGLRVAVLEASPRAGGWVHTTVRDGYLCERGPQGFRPTADSDAFVEALGLGAAVVPASPAAKRRWLCIDGRLHELPHGPGSLLRSRLFSWGACLRLLREPWIGRGRDAGESLADFAVRRFGRSVRPLAEAFARGIFAGDADRIEMAAAFPAVTVLEQEHGSLLRGMRAARRQQPKAQRVVRPALCSFAGGMATSVQALCAALGDRVRLGVRAAAISRGPHGWQLGVEAAGGDATPITTRELALALPAHRAAALVRPLDAELGSVLSVIPFASVASTYLGAPGPAFAADLGGFGCLQPKRSGVEGRVLGALFCASTFPDHAPPGMQLLRVMSGGIEHDDETARSDQHLQDQAVAFARRVLGLRTTPTFVHVERAAAAIPQYERGHRQLLLQCAQRLQLLPGLRLLGASYRQVSVVGQWSVAGSAP